MLNTNRISPQKHLFLPWTELRQTTYILALYFAPIFALKVFYKYEKYIENVKKNLLLAIFILTTSLKIKSILWRHKCQLLRALKFFACWEKMATLLLNERKFTNTHRTTVHTAAYCCLMIEVYSLSTCWVQYWDQCWEKKQQKILLKLRICLFQRIHLCKRPSFSKAPSCMWEMN